MKPNPLIIIAIIFAGSFAGRAIGVANATLKQSPNPAIDTAAAKTDMAPDIKTNDQQAKPLSQIDTPTSSMPQKQTAESLNAAEKNKLLAAIRDRSKTLDERETEIEDRVRILEIIETRIDKKLVELKKSNDDLSELVAYADEAAQKDIELLSKMYEQMKPQRAGEIFNKMNPTFAAGFLTEMNSENAALILMNMNTDKAYETSMIIASRNAAVHHE